MGINLYNTLTRRKEPFEPRAGGDRPQVTMYVCGPTVYSAPHIGNARPAVVFDVLARLLRRDYDLTYARNITDVDDKINAAAREAGVGIDEIAAQYADVYHEDMKALGVLPVDVEPRATDHIDSIIAMITELIRADHAYEADGHVLFRVASYGDYGALSRRDQRELLAGARVEVAPYKEAPGDFVLWKPSTPDLPGLGEPVGPRSSRLAHRMLGDGRGSSRPHDRHTRRRQRPDIPASRERNRAEHVRARRRAVRALLAAQRLRQRGQRKDVEVAR